MSSLTVVKCFLLPLVQKKKNETQKISEFYKLFVDSDQAHRCQSTNN